MTIGKDKTRTNITISKKLKENLELIAVQENRSFNNLIITVLKNFEANKRKQNSHDFEEDV